MAWLHVPKEFVPSANSPSAPGSAESLSVFNSLSAASVLFVTASGKATRRRLSWRGWRTRPWMKLLSGTTLSRSQAKTGVERWISYQRASLASHFRTPEIKKESKTFVGSGPPLPRSFATYNPGLCSWRTPQDSSSTDSDGCFEIWPNSGSMRSGICSPPPTSVLHTCGVASSSWPPPTVSDSKNNGGPAASSRNSEALHFLAAKWPTPCTTDAASAARHTTTTGVMTMGTSLTDALRGPWVSGLQALTSPNSGDKSSPSDPTSPPLWTTACKDDTGARQGRDAQGGTPLSLQAKGFLSPNFVEWLMGYPIGWTGCDASGTPWFPRWSRTHGAYLLRVLKDANAVPVASRRG